VCARQTWCAMLVAWGAEEEVLAKRGRLHTPQRVLRASSEVWGVGDSKVVVEFEVSGVPRTSAR
jgi:hypothetical protein